MKIPLLQPSSRKREYDSYSYELRSQVIRGWLFSNKTHRQLDEEILGLDRDLSRGYQSMGILHFLGLKADFHALFNNIPEPEAIDLLKAEQQDYRAIISFLEDEKSTINIQKLIEDETREIDSSKKDTS